MTWKQTFTGKAFDLLDPRPEMVDIRDIAHSLAHQCRYTGHTIAHYSVAQHSILVAGRVPGPLRLAALLHDAHEAYVGDVSTPLKVALQYEGAGMALDRIVWRIDRAIGAAFGVDPGLFRDPAIKAADLRALATERRILLGPEPRPWDVDAEPFPGTIVPWPAEYAERAFLECFQSLVSR